MKIKPEWSMREGIREKMTIPHDKPTVEAEELKAVIAALSNLELTRGTKIKEFERAFSEFIWINSAATSSGTSALHLDLVEAGGY